MKELLLTLLHLAVMTAKLCGPGGVRAVIAENLLLKQQLIVLRRARQRAPNLALSDRLICGLGSLFLSPGRIRKVAIGLRPSTLLAFHQALVRGITSDCSRRARARRSPDRRGRARHSSKPSSSSSRAILGLAVRGSRAFSRTRSGSIDKNVVYRVLSKHYRPAPGGTGPSWLSFIGHTRDSLWSVDLFRCESIVLQSYWVLVVMDQFTRRLVGSACTAAPSRAPTFAACSTPPFMVGAHRDISVPITIPFRGASLDGEPADSGDRRNQDRTACAPVPPIRGALDRHDAARISRPCAVLECP